MDNDSRKEIVKKDFWESLEKIDFDKAYDPFSREYQTALNLGLMAFVLCNLARITKNEVKEQKEESIESRIAEAKKKLQKYLETGDMSFKQSSDEELSRAETLIKKAYARLPSGDEKTRLKAFESEIEEIRKA